MHAEEGDMSEADGYVLSLLVDYRAYSKSVPGLKTTWVSLFLRIYLLLPLLTYLRSGPALPMPLAELMAACETDHR